MFLKRKSNERKNVKLNKNYPYNKYFVLIDKNQQGGGLILLDNNVEVSSNEEKKFVVCYCKRSNC